MNTEQFKLLLEMIEAAGDGAMTLAILWLGKDFMLNLVGKALIAALIYAAWRVFKPLVESLNEENQRKKAERPIMDWLTNRYEIVGYLASYEARKIIADLERADKAGCLENAPKSE